MVVECVGERDGGGAELHGQGACLADGEADVVESIDTEAQLVGEAGRHESGDANVATLRRERHPHWLRTDDAGGADRSGVVGRSRSVVARVVDVDLSLHDAPFASVYRRRDSRIAVPFVVSTETLSIKAIMIGSPSPRGGTAAETRQFPGVAHDDRQHLVGADVDVHADRRGAVFEGVVDRLATRQDHVIGGLSSGMAVHPIADAGPALGQLRSR